MIHMAPKRWRRSQALLGVLASLLALTVFAPRLNAPAAHFAAPISIAANAYTDYALIAIPFKSDDNLWAVKPNKHDIRGKRVLARDTLTSLPTDSQAIPNLGPYLKQTGNLANTSSDLHQVYLLLDIPPPAA